MAACKAGYLQSIAGSSSVFLCQVFVVIPLRLDRFHDLPYSAGPRVQDRLGVYVEGPPRVFSHFIGVIGRDPASWDRYLALVNPQASAAAEADLYPAALRAVRSANAASVFLERSRTMRFFVGPVIESPVEVTNVDGDLDMLPSF
jgi:hypothetical protein